MGTALGFDTSCYTTSVALARDGQIIASRRRLLTVEQGERGSRHAAIVTNRVMSASRCPR